MDANIDVAARWWVDVMQEPYDEKNERPRVTRVEGTTEAVRVISVYADRVVSNLRGFLSLSPYKQRRIMIAQQDGFWWRGEREDLWRQGRKIFQFELVLHECERRQEMGTEAYRKEAIERIRRYIFQFNSYKRDN